MHVNRQVAVEEDDSKRFIAHDPMQMPTLRHMDVAEYGDVADEVVPCSICFENPVTAKQSYPFPRINQ